MKRRSIVKDHDSDEEAIWDLKPKKKAFVGKSNPSKIEKNKTTQPKKRPIAVSQAKYRKQNDKHDKVENGVRENVTPKKTPHDGHCPFCQMPFSALILESPRCHALQCMDLPLKTTQECPDGSECNNTIASHFRTYLHSSLAQLRAGPNDSQADEQTKGKTEDVQEQKISQTTASFTEIKSHNEKDDIASAEEQPCCTEKDVMKPGTSDSSAYIKKFTYQTQKSKMPAETIGFENTSSISKQPESTIAKRKLCFVDSKPEATTSISDQDQDQEQIPVTEDVNDGKRLSSDSLQNIFEDDTESFKTKDDNYSDSQYQDNCDSQVSVISPAIKDQPGCFDYKNDDQAESSQGSKLEGVEINSIEFSDGDDELLSCVSDLESANQASDLPSKTADIPATVGDKYSNATSNITKATSGTTDNAFKRRRTPTKNQLPPRTQGQLSIHSFFQPKTGLKKSQTAPSCSKQPDIQLKSLTIPKPEAKKSWSTGMKSSFSKVSQARNGDSGDKKFSRQCPFYKKIPGTAFTVDAFRFGDIPDCKAYFLTHFHYDHYGGLRKSFNHPLYCSKVTRNLVMKKIGVDNRYLHDLPMNTPVMVDGVEVTLLEANHCPGAVLFLFRLCDGRTMLHTGDFRASLAMEDYPALKGIHVHTLYLDTTYCDPSHSFPPQEDVIRRGVDIATEFMHHNPNGLVVVGSYTIGKERIFVAIAEALGSKVCVTGEKKTILDCLEDPSIDKLLTKDGKQAKVHVLKMGQLRHDDLKAYLKKFHGRYDAVLAIEPTGWTHNKATPSLENIRPKWSRDGVIVYGLPYSEHSSYTEMKRFTQFVRPETIIPTVNNGNPSSRQKMQQLFQSWLKESPTSSPRMKQARLGQWLK